MVDIMRHMDHLGPAGKTLSVSERSGLQVSMLQREHEESLPSKMLFWGKVEGVENDYLICYALVEPSIDQGDFPVKKYYFCLSSDTALRLMPVLSEDYAARAKLVNGRFRGDPSFPLDEEPEEVPDEDAEPPERFREMHRLAHTVQQVDRAAAVVPRGALLAEPSRRIRPFRNYEGLGREAALDLRSYFHYRPPESAQAAAALAKKGLLRSRDSEFLDPISADRPQGCWALTTDSTSTLAVLRSLAWPGYYFFHQVGTGDYGGAYFGNGLPNPDLAFML